MKEPDKYKEIKEEITAIYHENKGRYGYRRVTMELHNRGICINHKTVRKLMKELGLQCLIRVQKYKSYKGTIGTICDNLLNREFEAEKPNEKCAVFESPAITSCGFKKGRICRLWRHLSSPEKRAFGHCFHRLWRWPATRAFKQGKSVFPQKRQTSSRTNYRASVHG